MANLTEAFYQNVVAPLLAPDAPLAGCRVGRVVARPEREGVVIDLDGEGGGRLELWRAEYGRRCFAGGGGWRMNVEGAAGRRLTRDDAARRLELARDPQLWATAPPDALDETNVAALPQEDDGIRFPMAHVLAALAFEAPLRGWAARAAGRLRTRTPHRSLHYAAAAYVLLNGVLPWTRGRRAPVIVDIGAFLGSFVQALRPFCRVMGLESVPHYVALGRLAGVRELRWGDAARLERHVPPGTADALVYTHFFNADSVVRRPSPEPFVRAAAAALRPGGWLLVQGPGALTHALLARHGLERYRFPVPATPYAPVHTLRRGGSCRGRRARSGSGNT